MNSLRLRLFVILLVTTGVVWLSAIGWIYFSTQQQVEKVLDARLREAAKMVNSLITDKRISVASAVRMGVEANRDFKLAGHPYERQLSCQIWSLNGALIGQSDGAPQQALATHDSGFQQTTIGGDKWRVYAVVNKQLGVRVLVGDSLQVRQRLVDNVIKGLLLPAALILPLLAVLIWVCLGSGLMPLRRLASGLAKRSANDLHPVPAAGLPEELLPVSRSLNGLFARLQDARERERSFTAFAAHELKTPLAGLRTQAQVALASPDGETRDQALRRIVQGVDRTSRLVRQLLDLAEAESDRDKTEEAPECVADLLHDLVDELAPTVAMHGSEVAFSSRFGAFSLTADRLLFVLAIRNVLENALQHAPPKDVVACDLEEDGDRFVIRIADRGLGMSENDLAHACDRFYRAAGARAGGSGLGLSIARAAVEKMGGSIELALNQPSGLVVRLRLPGTVFEPYDSQRDRVLR